MKKATNKISDIKILKMNLMQSDKTLISIAIVVFIFYLMIFSSSFMPSFKGVQDYGSRDANLYVQMSYQLIEDGIYGYNSTSPNAYVTPSQPFYITSLLLINKVLNMNDMLLITIFNILLNIGSIILIFQICNNLFKNRKISFIAALLFATYFPNVYFVRTALTETPAIFFMMFSIYIFIKAIENDKKSLYMIFSVIYAITIMFRPALSPLLLIGFYIIWKKFGFKGGTKRLLYFGTGFILIILPWIARNYIMFDNFYVFSSHGGDPLLGGTYPYYLEEYDASIPEQLGMTKEEYAKHRIIEGFKQDPKLYISWFTVGKILWLFGGPNGWLYYSEVYHSLTPIVYLQHFLIFFAAMFAIYKFRRKDQGIKAISYFSILYILIHLGFIAITRFGYLIFPVLSILAGYSIVKSYEWIKNNKQKIFRYPTKAIKFFSS